MQQEADIQNANKFMIPFRSKKKIMFYNFLGGLFWAFGTFVGLAIIAVIAGFIISKIDLVPIIGGWLSDILSNASGNLRTPVSPVTR